MTHRDFISQRRSATNFSGAPIDQAVIEACAHTKSSAPSDVNHQPWHFVCVTDAVTKRTLAEATEEAGSAC
ncbi:MAG: hypothetical protein CME57_06980 [Halieaceae bacterium]|nr:hypothetical protein [Halieaceae bacterium]